MRVTIITLVNPNGRIDGRSSLFMDTPNCGSRLIQF